ncbi:unnamed protein product [Leuciscus chuanchicus]
MWLQICSPAEDIKQFASLVLTRACTPRGADHYQKLKARLASAIYLTEFGEACTPRGADHYQKLKARLASAIYLTEFEPTTEGLWVGRQLSDYPSTVETAPQSLV